WAATTGGIVRWDANGGAFQQFLAPQDGLRANDVYDLALAANGDVWAATAGGVSRYATPTWITLRIGERDMPQGDFRAVAVGPDGAVWAGTVDGVVYAFWGNAIPQAAFRMQDQPITDIVLDQEGRRWVASWLGVTVLSDQGVLTYTAQNSGLPPGIVNALLVLTDSTVLAATDTGVARFQNGAWMVYAQDSGAPGGATALAQTADGTLWAASPQGIWRYDGQWRCVGAVRETAVEYAALWKQPMIRSERWPILAAGGRIWAILDTGLADFDGQMWARRSTTGTAPPSNRVRALAIGPDGALWAGFAGSAPARYEAGRWVTFAGREQAPTNVNAILADPEGRIWFAADDGVALYDGQRWTKFKSGEGGLVSGRALSLAWDPAGTLWVGAENGVSARRKDSWTSHVAGANGLAGGRVR
ncbi:MAG: ligand-binding sensor domain-containing protein, partial [Anaerolineae bacterium]